MSDLRVILSVAGAILIVLIFAWYKWQERSLKRRGNAAFGSRHDDALLSPAQRPAAATSAERIEPVMRGLDAGATDGANPVAPLARRADEPLPAAEPPPMADLPPLAQPETRIESALPVDDRIDAVALITASEEGAVEAAPLLEMDWTAYSKTVSRFGEQAGIWRELEPGRSYRRVVVSMQLVDRKGPVPGMEFAAFAGQLEGLAKQNNWQLELASSESVLNRAADLDRLCLEVDFQISFDIVAANNRTFPGTRIRGLAEANALELSEDGSFRRVDGGGAVWFRLKNRGATPFSPDLEHMREFSTRGLTLVLDVPRVPREAFPALRALLNGLCNALQGTVVDEQGRRLDDAALDLVDDQLRSIHGRLEQSGIVPGSALALRLFS
jgi:FtsZ-interacting cell division protein ZipA